MLGAVLMVGSMTSFTVNDAFMKALSDELPLFQAIFLRGVGTSLMLLALAVAFHQFTLAISRKDWGWIGLRTCAEAGAAYFFISALFNMPIANATAIIQALPLTVTLAGAVFLGEAVGWRRFMAIVVGFCGVLLVVQPGSDGFNIYSLYVLAAVACVTLRDLVVRRLSAEVPSLLTAFAAALGVCLFAGLGSLTENWAPLSITSGFQLLGSMTAIIGAYVFSVTAMRHGEISFVAPFRYVSLVAALLIGWLVFNHWPDALTLFGAGIIVLTGLFTLYRESLMSKRHQ